MDNGGGEEPPPEDGEEPTEEQSNLLINSTKQFTKFERFKQTRRKFK
jgi:hypothetical protein